MTYYRLPLEIVKDHSSYYFSSDNVAAVACFAVVMVMNSNVVVAVVVIHSSSKGNHLPFHSIGMDSTSSVIVQCLSFIRSKRPRLWKTLGK